MVRTPKGNLEIYEQLECSFFLFLFLYFFNRYFYFFEKNFSLWKAWDIKMIFTSFRRSEQQFILFVHNNHMKLWSISMVYEEASFHNEKDFIVSERERTQMKHP